MRTEGKAKGGKVDFRSTKEPRTLGLIAPMNFDNPEQAAQWFRDALASRSLVLPSKLHRFCKLCPDLVVVIKQREPRANTGVVDIATVELKRSQLHHLGE